MNEKWDVIIEVGGEGGTIKLVGQKDEIGNWIYKRDINEIDFDEDIDYTPKERIHLHEHIIYNWEDALDSLNCYPWPRLVLLKIHPEFRDKVWKEIVRYEKMLFIPERWLNLCYPDGNKAAELAFWMKRSHFTVVLTGAGMSTESGIPDFRSRDGWWKNIDPKSVATIEAMKNNYEIFHNFYNMRIEGLKESKPHEGHYILERWEERGLIQSIATQNVDGFHQRAGNKKVYELHGSLNSARCNNCEKQHSAMDFVQGITCPDCRGRLRPNVVLFGEKLPKDAWNNAFSDIKKADLVIVIGTSLEVYPVNTLPSITKGKIALINKEKVNGSNRFNLFISGKAGEVLKEIDALL